MSLARCPARPSFYAESQERHKQRGDQETQRLGHHVLDRQLYARDNRSQETAGGPNRSGFTPGHSRQNCCAGDALVPVPRPQPDGPAASNIKGDLMSIKTECPFSKPVLPCRLDVALLISVGVSPYQYSERQSDNQSMFDD